MELNEIADPCCVGCLNKVSKDSKNIRLAVYWHQECFRCSVCDLRLSDWYFESKQKKVILCRNDYLKLYSNHCQQCGEILSGPFMSADEHKFHPECFQCWECGEHIGDAEEYILVERSKVFNRKCFEGKAAPHTIHLIKINLQQNKVLPIKLCVEQSRSPTSKNLLKSEIKISEIDEAYQKHIGDKVLEVNGISTKNASIDSISDIVSNSDKIVQLTIEHKLNQLIEQGSQKSELHKNQNERLFKKKSDVKSIHNIHNRHTATNNLKGKERSSSMSKLLGPSSSTSTNELYDLSRTKSFRVEDKAQKIFRPSDLVQGELLGKGFFGQVYKITEKRSGQIMVLKELYRVDSEAQKNFLKEIAVLKSLNHPNVLRFIGVLYKNSKLHLITEFVPRTLNEIIHNSNTILPHTQRISFAKDIATGMSYLHNNNIIHRDLNSFNCLVREDMSVIVADFGLARIISQPPRYKTTSKILNKLQNNNKIRHRKQRYTIVGNPYWMAVEMLRGDKYDEKVDVFSFGIVICELIGRVQADPDFLPRSSDFGLNHQAFIEKFCDNCPEAFYLTAFVCCQLNPDKRPPFSLTEIWLKTLRTFVTDGFMDNSLKEVKNYILNNNIDLPVNNTELLDCKSSEVDGNGAADGNNDEFQKNPNEDSKLLCVTPKSPFFSRDFSETGERLRNSFRARRHKKSMQHKKQLHENADDNILLCDTSESEPLSLIEITNEAKESLANVEHTLNKVSQKLENDQRLNLYGKDAFVIKMDDGVFSIKDIKNLENMSDLDSSCDTSLNFIESSLSGDNNNFDSHSLEYNGEKYLAETNEVRIPIKNKLLPTNNKLLSKEAKSCKKESDQVIVLKRSPHYSVGKKNLTENKYNHSTRGSTRKTTETKSNTVKIYSPKIQLNKSIKDTSKVPQKKDSLNKDHDKSFYKHTATSAKLNPASTSVNRCSISEKTTESTRAKIKVKVPISSSKQTPQRVFL